MIIGKTKCFVHAAVSNHKKVNSIEFPESHNIVHSVSIRTVIYSDEIFKDDIISWYPSDAHSQLLMWSAQSHVSSTMMAWCRALLFISARRVARDSLYISCISSFNFSWEAYFPVSMTFFRAGFSRPQVQPAFENCSLYLYGSWQQALVWPGTVDSAAAPSAHLSFSSAQCALVCLGVYWLVYDLSNHIFFWTKVNFRGCPEGHFFQFHPVFIKLSSPHFENLTRCLTAANLHISQKACFLLVHKINHA